VQKFLIVILLFWSFSNSSFISANVQDSRIQFRSFVYNPGGVIGGNIRFGIFNEPENTLDFYTSIAISRFGYSHTINGHTYVTDFWCVDLIPLNASVTYRKFEFEVRYLFSYAIIRNRIPEHYNVIFHGNGLTPHFFGYGYTLGYRLKNEITIGINATYHVSEWENQDGTYPWGLIGGIGLEIKKSFN